MNRSLVEEFGRYCDLYILPVSTHEIFIMPVMEKDEAEREDGGINGRCEEGRDINALKNIVGEANIIVETEEKLSDNIYIYNCVTKELRIVE